MSFSVYRPGSPYAQQVAREHNSRVFRKHLEWASGEVARWPAWKRNVLPLSMTQYRTTPRQPVERPFGGQHIRVESLAQSFAAARRGLATRPPEIIAACDAYLRQVDVRGP